MLKHSVGRLALIGLLCSASLQAEDIDRYLGRPGQYPAINVLILLDNSAAALDAAAWPAYADCAAGSTLFCYEKAVLRELGQELAGQPVSAGLMLFSKAEAGAGAYVRAALRPLSSAGSADWITRINALNPVDDTGATASHALALHEAYLYLRGQVARSGVIPAADRAAFEDVPRYRHSTAACGRDHLIIINQGEPDSTENSLAESLLAARSGKWADDPLPLSPSDHRVNWADEYARYLRLSGITTHSLDVSPTGSRPARASWLRSIAREGRGHYAAIHSIRDLQQALRAIFRDVEPVQGRSSAVLPADPTQPGLQLPQVYTGLFKTVPTVRWTGNLKLNGLDRDTVTTGLTSQWTFQSDYWQFRCGDTRAVVSECGNPPASSDAPDGAVTDKGGFGQHLRQTVSMRTLLTCPSAQACLPGTVLGATAETRFSADNPAIKPPDLAVADATERDRLVAWVRGEDNLDVPERKTGEVRPSVTGETIHARPVVLDYNRSGGGCRDQGSVGQDVVVFHADNQGMIHAVRGGNAAADAGTELWGFIPREAWSQFRRVRENSAVINFPSLPLDPDNKPYLLDGPLTVWADDANHDCRYTPGVDSVWLFAGMGRAGRSMYALDVTEPERPRFLWYRDNNSPGFAELGQTWSAPQPTWIRQGQQRIPALLMGAGYDPRAEDRAYDLTTRSYQAPLAGQAGMGRGVFVLAARSGEILRFFGQTEGLNHSIASDLAILKQPGTGVAYRAYVGDGGGTVWRIELDDPDPQHWQLSVLARLGGAGTSARKFLYPPDVVRYDRGHAVLLGSGDREHPFDSLSRNRFFMVKDEGGHRSVTCDTESDTCDLADASLASTPPDNPDGWYYPLEPGESVSGSGTTWAGTVYFATRRMAVADPLACHGNPDVSRLYALNYLTAAPAWPEQSRYRETSGAMPQTPALLAIASQPDATPGQATATPPESTSVRRGILVGDTVESVAIPESARKMERLWWYRESENPP